MDMPTLLRERDAIEQNLNAVSDPYLIDYFLYHLAAQEALIGMTIRDAKDVKLLDRRDSKTP